MDSDQKSVISFHHPFGGDCVCLWEGVRTPGREWSLFWWDFKQRICFFCVCVELLFSPFLWLCRGSWGSCHFQAQWRVWKCWTLLQILILVGLGSKKWISESLFFFLDWTASHLPFSPAGLEIGLWWAVSGYHLWKPRPAESSDFAGKLSPALMCCLCLTMVCLLSLAVAWRASVKGGVWWNDFYRPDSAVMLLLKQCGW